MLSHYKSGSDSDNETTNKTNCACKNSSVSTLSLPDRGLRNKKRNSLLVNKINMKN